jgi:hypothetical protein
MVTFSSEIKCGPKNVGRIDSGDQHLMEKGYDGGGGTGGSEV